MKAKIVRTDMEAAPDAPDDICELKSIKRNGRMRDVRFIKVESVIEHPQSFRLVQQGVAVPADEECATTCGMSGDEMKAAQHAYNRVNAGIHPDDYAKYDAGIMVGYNPDGSYKPGPNFHLLAQQDEGDE